MNTMRLILSLFLVSTLTACSLNQMLVRASLPIIEGGIEALNQETDLELAEAAIPTNLEMLEGMIIVDPDNDTLHTYAAQAYYGLAYGFNEDIDPERASRFYQRGLKHGLSALEIKGLKNISSGSVDKLETELKQLIKKDDVPALFWTASCWAKWIDMNRDASESIVQLPRATALMRRVLELDENFYHGGAHMYFGVYYGGRSPSLGGNFKKAKYHFNKARAATNGKLLIADLLQAQYLSRQQFDHKDFRTRLTKIIEAPDDLYPELGLLNQVAKRKARAMLSKEKQWF